MGVVWATGTASRRFPLTKITNSHRLPVHDKPMIVTGGRNGQTGFDEVRPLKCRDRRELDITGAKTAYIIKNAYIKEGSMSFSYLDGWWTDAGTLESLLRARSFVAGKAERVGE